MTFNSNLAIESFLSNIPSVVDEIWDEELRRGRTRSRPVRRQRPPISRPRAPRRVANIPQRSPASLGQTRPVRTGRPTTRPPHPKPLYPKRPRPPKVWPPVVVGVYPYPAWPPPEPPRPTPSDYPPESSSGSGAAPESAAPASAQSSEYVRWIQSTLNLVMKLRLPIDGLMGPETRSAIRDFQEQSGLPKDGIVGQDTKAALLAARKSGNGEPAPPARPTGKPEEEYFLDTIWSNFRTPKGQVDRQSRAYIQWVQSGLNKIMGLHLAVDGISGSQTRSAVRSFQSHQGLTADGIVGPITEQALINAGAGQPPQTGSPSSAPTTNKWVLPASVRTAGEAQSVRYDNPPPWQNGRNCTGTFTRGAAELRDYIRATFPGVRSIGGYNCRPNSANTSQTSVHGTGRALDIMIAPVNGRANSAVGDPIANWLVQNAAQIGVQYIIWNRVQWSGHRSGRKDRDYGGPNPHIDHIHVELNNDGATRRTPWFTSRTQREREFWFSRP